jgi:hypothetical protein
MHPGKTVFSQLLQWIHPEQFARCVRRYRGDYKVRSFSCWDQFLCLVFAQLTFRESLRDIATCLGVRSDLYYLGFRCPIIARSTLAEANESRDWRIYADLAAVLIRRARKLYATEDIGLVIEQTVYALDATTIDLCLSLFPWARFRTTKGAIKMNTLLDLRGHIPVNVHITDGKTHEVRWLDLLTWEPGSIYLIDRGYLDFSRLYRITLSQAYFVTRAKDRLSFCRLYSHPINPGSQVRCDQTISLSGFYPARDYPDKLRRIRFYDVEQKRALVFLTNHFGLPAEQIAALYRRRWQVELFFKWIKQHLRVKAFYGTSNNAVKTQLWSAICTYVLVMIMKKELAVRHDLHTIFQLLSLHPFEKVPLEQLLTKTYDSNQISYDSNQLMFNYL